MDRPFHDRGTHREGGGHDKAWWEVDAILSGSYERNTFVRWLLDHMSSQDEPVGGNPPTYGDIFGGKARDKPIAHRGRPPEVKSSRSNTPQVSLVVQVPGKAKAESDECPKIQALRDRLKEKYGSTFFSGKLVFPPASPWTVRRGQDTAEAEPPSASSPGVRSLGQEERGHGEDPRGVYRPGLVGALSLRVGLPLLRRPQVVGSHV